MYNSLRYAKILEESGFTKQQAEVQVQMITEIVETNFATKQDLKNLGTELRQEIKDLENCFELRFRDLENRMVLMEHRLTIKLGTIMSAAIGLSTAIITAVIKLT